MVKIGFVGFIFKFEIAMLVTKISQSFVTGSFHEFVFETWNRKSHDD